jgi:hypothetical protein
MHSKWKERNYLLFPLWMLRIAIRGGSTLLGLFFIHVQRLQSSQASQPFNNGGA